MAVAADALEEAAAWRAASRASGHVRNATRALPSGGQSGHPGFFIRAIWAFAAGLVVLELISLATGRFWSWDFGAPFRASTATPRPYTSLPGGQVPDWGFIQASAPGAAFPGGPGDRNTGQVVGAPVDAGNLGSGRR